MATDTKLIEICLQLDRSMPVLAYTTEVPGLVITPKATTHRVVDDEFNVTHEASGWAVLRGHTFNSVEVARLFALAIKDDFDWTVSRDQFNDTITGMEEAARNKWSEELHAKAIQVEKMVESNPVLYLGIRDVSED